MVGSVGGHVVSSMVYRVVVVVDSDVVDDADDVGVEGEVDDVVEEDSSLVEVVVVVVAMSGDNSKHRLLLRRCAECSAPRRLLIG